MNQIQIDNKMLNRRNNEIESNENDFESSLQNTINYPPPRTPFNSIPDPSQYQSEPHESDAESHFKFEPTRPARSDRVGNGYHRGSARNGKSLSEPNSAQNTPARTGSRVSIGGGSKGRVTSSCSLLKGVLFSNNTELSMSVPHFELKDDPSFWMDHNVQVMIRIRPLNTMENLSQGYGRCLKQESAQSLVWLGHPETRFTFDHIACETLSQENLFRVAGVPMVENCLSGYNSCMFAYGQTGSGKTYTMMGELKETEGNLTEDSGITPRVFDYLFMRIKAEQESRWDHKLKYSCKCSFLEIYNEQITDLLEPSSTNLQLREDLKKGVYVENLTEHSVETVNDVLRLLLQGTANRKVAATHMNCESSRSHSVFTCIIESHWEKDSKTHFRFARLNLVDLAGSERQKSSGTDSERLKEAANINKSLSTLGLVIMTLVDLAHGKPRHVPYRDSRLTFLLQDSLGGNSKTMIIANVSPSICSANETLSTLKFAQRAKLIQNNAKVNEDASGDISALQWQIEQLKGQLSFLMKNKYFPIPVSNLEPTTKNGRLSDVSERYDSLGERVTVGHKLHFPNKEMKSMKVALLGAFRREKMAQTTIQNLQAEIEGMNCLVQQREKDAQHTTILLRHSEKKIKELELLVDDKLTAEKYLMEENRSLQEEIKLLQASVDKNAESSKLALENDKLLQQLQLLQNFCEHGERERLLTELDELREQLLVTLEENFTLSMKNEEQDINTDQELEDCRNMNSKLIREVDKLQTELGNCLNYNQALNSSYEYPDEFLKTNKCSWVETIYMRSDSGDEMPSFTWEAGDALANIIDGNALGSSILLAKDNEDNNSKVMESKLEKMSKNLEEVKLLNDQYQEKWASQLSEKQQIEMVCQEVEMETTRTILHLQDEVASIQSELEGRLCSIAQENTELRNVVAAKEEEVRRLSLEWEKGILELTTFLIDGSRSLKDACGEVKSISCSFPYVNAWITEQVGTAVKKYIEKEETIQQLRNSLEDAQKMVLDMELKISTLKEAAVALSAFEQLDNNEGVEEATQLKVFLNENTKMVRVVENDLNYKNIQLCKAAKQSDAAFVVAKWLSHNYVPLQKNGVEEYISVPGQNVQARQGCCTIYESQDVGNNLILNDLLAQVDLTKLEVLEMENAVKDFFIDTETQIAASQTGALGISSAYRDLIQDLVKYTQEMRKEVRDLRMMVHGSSDCYTVDSLISNENKYQVFADCHLTLCQIKEQLVEMNRRLNIIENDVSAEVHTSSLPMVDVDLIDADEFSADSSSISGFSTETESISSESKLHGSRYTCNLKFPGKITAISCVSKELHCTYTSFRKVFVHLSALLEKLDDGSCSYPNELNKEAVPFPLKMQKDEAHFEYDTEVFGFRDVQPADGFLTNFMEANATVKEADLMLHALTEAFEDSKQVTVMWKQAGENLMVERASLADDIQKLKLTICQKEEENQLLKEYIHVSLTEMTNSVSMLEECFLQVQTDVEKRFMMMYPDVLVAGQEMLYFINSLRSSVEDICSQIVGEGFVSFVVSNSRIIEHVSKCTSICVKHDFKTNRQGGLHSYPKNCSSGAEPVKSIGNEGTWKKDQYGNVQEEPDLSNVGVKYENTALRKELERKQELLEGLLFDFRLLQESTSNSKDIKDHTEKLIFSLSQVQYELEIKQSQLDDMLVKNRTLEGSLADIEKALTASNYELELAKESTDKLSDQNTELRELLKEFYGKKSEAEGQLDEHKEVIKGLEKEIANLTALLENQSLSLFENIDDELRIVINERNQLQEEVCALNDKLEMAYSFVDEKEAIAIEARQESESSKLYAEQKEEEVRILEHSVEELESTVNVLEKKVHEMDEEVEGHRLMCGSLEMELHAVKERLLLVSNLSQNADSDRMSVQTGEQISSKMLEPHEALNRIKHLEKENAEQDKEIKKCKEYISEIVLHAEAQASQYQQKYKCLESMFREVKTEMSYSASEKFEKSSTRTRGSSSPFRCISNIVQQMNQEKDQELSAARLRVEELEALAAGRQKELCMLQARLGAAESMTHDVIRDLLGVKLDITNYAELIDQNQILKLVEDAHHQREEFSAKEKENLDLRLRINDLFEERESCVMELKTKEADILATQIEVQQLQERDQLLSAQNEMLKMDKTSLLRKVAELDDMVKKLTGIRNTQHVPQSSKTKDMGNVGVSRRLSQSQRLSRVNDQLAQYYNSAGNNSHG
ncbi:PREDICTED: kinesin-like protein KIN-12C isoform X2 [Lupinus angustifolius]|uniref:kinesin-like protein KIN-12C isoform X2 n=1 Tax=Lupinus angustifolius TaxID=3871 RepID=UPI00092FD881|nr:PREDICTED: kinesin-like protein KIN-12C isoform X2 [Lupinus angustifolius]